MRRAILTTLVLSALLLGPAARGQSLNEQLDQDRFLRGLAEYGLHDLLDYVLESSGANDAALPALVEIAHLQARLGETLLSTISNRASFRPSLWPVWVMPAPCR